MTSELPSRNPVAHINFPGMFDLIKGYALLCIVFTHTKTALFREDIPSWCNGILRLVFLETFCMDIFFIISGFGFRKTTFRKALKNQSKGLLRPYLITTVFTLIGFCICRVVFFGSVRNALVDTLGSFLGFLFGLHDSFIIGPFYLPEVAPMWFLIALFLSWLMLNAIESHVSERYRTAAVLGGMILGYLLMGIIPQPVPWSIRESLCYLPDLYFGYLIKKKNLLDRNLSALQICLMAAFTVLWSILPAVVPDSIQPVIGLLHLCSLIPVYLLLWIAVRLNRHQFPLKNVFTTIGRYSIWFVCLHQIENCALPWKNINAKLYAMGFGHFSVLIQYCAKCLIIFIMFRILLLWNKKQANIKREQRKHRRQSNS